MAKTSYPTATNVEDFLEAGGVTTTAAQQAFFAAAALAGRQIVEMRCGRQFLGSGSNATRYFDAPTARSGRLRIDDLATLNTVTYQPAGQAVATTWTLNTDFWLEPDNYAVREVPITSLVLRSRWVSPLLATYRRSVIISGQWGYGTAALGFPDAVWFAMIAAGLLTQWEIFAQALTGGLLSWQEADVHEDYGVEPMKRLRSSWEDRVDQAVRLYHRAEI